MLETGGCDSAKGITTSKIAGHWLRTEISPVCGCPADCFRANQSIEKQAKPSQPCVGQPTFLEGVDADKNFWYSKSPDATFFYEKCEIWWIHPDDYHQSFWQ
jgi:hypothetical protein